MATRHVVRYSRQHASATSQVLFRNLPFRLPSQCICRCHRPSLRLFSASSKQYQQQKDYKESFGTRLRKALSDTKIQWYPIPVGLGIAFLGLAQFYKVNEREKAKRREEEEDGYARSVGSDGESEGRPKKRHRVKPTGPWQVQVMSTLPLKAMSRIWGKFNELEIPYYLRVPGFKLYSFIFGVNLSEVSEPDLHVYPNLASFFYRTLKPGVRPLDPNQNALLSPADGRVLQFGAIEGGEVEQVKGMTYSLDALLGSDKPGTTPNPSAPSKIFTPAKNPPDQSRATHRTGGVETIKEDEQVIKQDEEFATVNGISYTLPNLFSGGPQKTPKKSSDASTIPKPASEAEVRADLALGEKPWYTRLTSENRTALYYVVIYLAPGDYHRFHSPTAWVAEKRRHFAGELYSVSPYLQRTLPGLFTLNERVVLLGRWRWGFFSFIPVGATNVGSIKINFDRELRTNSLTTDTEADRAAEAAAKRGEPYSGFAEATYERASPILHGHALRRGEEMGGFQLGSTVVLVFEAPKGQRPSLDEGWMGEKTKRKGGWNWAVEKGQRVKMGEKIGWVDES